MKKYLIVIGIIILWFSSGFSQSLNEPNLENFKKMAEIKANSFSVYISTIANKTTSLDDKETAINQACRLFISDTVTIQISYCPSGGNPTIYSRTLIKYLRRLSMLNYDHITIEWIDVVMVKDLKKGTDGNYYGIISTVQRFTAVKGEYTYSDVTTKNIEVIKNEGNKSNSKILWWNCLSNQ